MNTRNLVTKLLIGASMLTAVLGAGCSCRDGDAERTEKEQQAKEQQDEQKKQAENGQQDDSTKQGLRIDPLGKFTTPGRCIGWTCF